MNADYLSFLCLNNPSKFVSFSKEYLNDFKFNLIFIDLRHNIFECICNNFSIEFIEVIDCLEDYFNENIKTDKIFY